MQFHSFQIVWLGRYLSETIIIFASIIFFCFFTAFMYTSLTIYLDASVVCQ